MAQSGYATAGSSLFGPSSAFYNLPFTNYQELATWVECFIDALGANLDILYQRYGSPTARANLLNPTVSSPYVNSDNLATISEPANNTTNTDTMLDLLAYLCGIPTPVNSHFTTDQLKALAGLTQDVLRFKGTRARILNTISKITGGIVNSTGNSPFEFVITIPSGVPSPGYGNWTPSTPSGSTDVQAWIFDAITNLVSNIFPAATSLHMSYALPFKAGISSAGQLIYNTGVRLNLLPNDHFCNWTNGVLDNWITSGVINQLNSSQASEINYLFAAVNGDAYCAQIDLSLAEANANYNVSQTISVNNQITHNFQVDYASPQNLYFSVYDVNNLLYFDATNNIWTSSVIYNPLTKSTNRTQYSVDITFNSASDTTYGTNQITITVGGLESSSQFQGTLYRAAIYETYDFDHEKAAGGPVSTWYPLIDAPGLTYYSASSGDPVVENAKPDRSSAKALTSNNTLLFPYHPALNGRGYLNTSLWTQLLKGSNDFGTDWSVSATTIGNVSSPDLLDGYKATQFNKTLTSNSISQTFTSIDNHYYIVGLWVHKPVNDGYNDVTLSLGSYSKTFTLSFDEWTLISTPTTAVSGTSNTFTISWASGQLAKLDVFAAYVYDLTLKTGISKFGGCLYPPVVISPVGANSAVSTNWMAAATYDQGNDILHPANQSQLIDINNGALTLDLVPVFDGDFQPDSIIFDSGQTSLLNRIVLQVSGHKLTLTQYDNLGNTRAVSLDMVAQAIPDAGQVNWQRDQKLSIVAIWHPNCLQMTAGLGNAVNSTYFVNIDNTKPTQIVLGADLNHQNHFDGIITNVYAYLG